MKRILILFLAFTFISSKADFESFIFSQFQRFITKYHKKYSSMQEFLSRFQVFRLNFKESLNAGSKNYLTGITKFSDLTRQEFTLKYLNSDFPAIAFLNKENTFKNTIKAAPDSWDWREHNAIAEVKDQGACGAAYAFSTICNLESLYAIKKSKIVPLSMQYIIDCDPYSSGCSGGFIDSTFKWLIENGGHLMSEADYPYKGTKGTCKADPSKYIDMTVTGIKKVSTDENEIKEVLYNTGALIAGVNGNALQTYSRGIIDLSSSQCPPSGINHVVNIVGYGNDSGLDYWICRNSWGNAWGESGYFRISRGKGTCGINLYVLTGTVSF